MKACQIVENSKYKLLTSPSYNYMFDKRNGNFIRFGGNRDEDPQFSPYGAEIADIEVSTVCTKGCPFCYKGNTANGKNMSLAKFKRVFDRLPKTLTQIAFGIGDINGNPDLEEIFKYCRANGIVPNVTINAHNMTSDQYDMLSKYCGAIAVSLYDYNDCYSAVYNLAQRGMKQVNIHVMFSHETFERCQRAISDAINDTRLVGSLNAIVFLHLKPKGRAEGGAFTIPSDDEFKELVEMALEYGAGFGFDSCSANKALKVLPPEMHQYVEPCESTLFSMYINVDGLAFPCSFAEGHYKGVDIEKINPWNADEYVDFRKKCLACNRKCPLYDLGDT